MSEGFVQSLDTRVDFDLCGRTSMRRMSVARKDMLTGSRVLEPANGIHYAFDPADCATVK